MGHMPHTSREHRDATLQLGMLLLVGASALLASTPCPRSALDSEWPSPWCSGVYWLQRECIAPQTVRPGTVVQEVHANLSVGNRGRLLDCKVGQDAAFVINKK